MKFFLPWIIHSTLIGCLKIEPSSTVIETITVLREPFTTQKGSENPQFLVKMNLVGVIGICEEPRSLWLPRRQHFVSLAIPACPVYGKLQ